MRWMVMTLLLMFSCGTTRHYHFYLDDPDNQGMWEMLDELAEEEEYEN